MAENETLRPALRPAPRCVWLGPPLKLHAPKVGEETPAFVAAVQTNTEAVVVASVDDGVLVAFPPLPYLWRVGPNALRYLQAGKEQAAARSTAAPGAVEALTPERLLTVLRDPNVVGVIQTLVATRPEETKAAAMPLLQPLIGALVPADKLGMVTAALQMFGVT